MKPEVLSALLGALGGGIGGKLLDLLYNLRKGRQDWYAEQLTILQRTITEQTARIDALEAKVDSQRATIRTHEDTITTQNRTIDHLRGRVTELEGKQNPQHIDLNVTMTPQE